MLLFERLDPAAVDWRQLDGLPDRTVFQTPAWLDFICASRGGELVIARITQNGSAVGWFSGVLIRKFGMKILGSPMAGWTSYVMGFNMLEPGLREQAAAGLRSFAFDDLGCMHFELADRELSAAQGQALGMKVTPWPSYEVNLERDDDSIFKSFSHACRKNLKRAWNNGLIVETVTDPAVFAAEMFEQMMEVFAKQGLAPNYDEAYYRSMFAAMQPSGLLLLQRVVSGEGQRLGTAVSMGGVGIRSFSWAATSWRASQPLRPNEILQWEAMRHWRERGAISYDLGGAGRDADTYKLKYSPQDISIARLRLSRYALLENLRELARRAIELKQKLRSRKPAAAATEGE
jgi:hypothetical protein